MQKKFCVVGNHFSDFIASHFNRSKPLKLGRPVLKKCIRKLHREEIIVTPKMRESIGRIEYARTKKACSQQIKPNKPKKFLN